MVKLYTAQICRNNHDILNYFRGSRRMVVFKTQRELIYGYDMDLCFKNFQGKHGDINNKTHLFLNIE